MKFVSMIMQQGSLVLRCKCKITQIHLEKPVYCEVIGRTLLFHMEDGKVLESVLKLKTNILNTHLAESRY